MEICCCLSISIRSLRYRITSSSHVSQQIWNESDNRDIARRKGHGVVRFLILLYSGPHRKATSKLVLRVRDDRSQTPANANHNKPVPIRLNLSNFPQSSESRSHGGGGGCSAGNCVSGCVQIKVADQIRYSFINLAPADNCRRTIRCMLLQRRSCCTTCSSKFPLNVS